MKQVCLMYYKAKCLMFALTDSMDTFISHWRIGIMQLLAGHACSLGRICTSMPSRSIILLVSSLKDFTIRRPWLPALSLDCFFLASCVNRSSML